MFLVVHLDVCDFVYLVMITFTVQGIGYSYYNNACGCSYSYSFCYEYDSTKGCNYNYGCSCDYNCRCISKHISTFVSPEIYLTGARIDNWSSSLISARAPTSFQDTPGTVANPSLLALGWTTFRAAWNQAIYQLTNQLTNQSNKYLTNQSIHHSNN